MKQKTRFKQTEIGKIPEDWEIKKIEDVAEVTMGQSPPGNSYNRYREGMRFLQGVRTFGDKHPFFDTYTTQVTKKAKAGSVLLSVRAPVGEVNVTKKEMCVGRGLASLNMNNGNNEFLYYLLKKFSALIIGRETGSVFGSINSEQIRNLELPFPEDSEQKSIAKILSDLDAKIELNDKMNKTLEAIGQAIFKKWFIDEQKEEWKEKPAENLFKLEYGWHLPVWDRKQGEYPVFGSGGLTGTHNEFFVEGPGVIVGRAGKIGPNSIYYSNINFCPIETTFYVKTENKKNIPFIYFLLKNLEIVNTGSSVPNLSRRDVHNILMLIPNQEIIDKFYDISYKLLETIHKNNLQSHKLSKIRDALLPKLMNGEIRVK